MRALGVIPARYQSSRFPGKALTLIAGVAMIERVYERAHAARTLSHLLVATDDARIARAVEVFGGEAIMTSSDHPSGTDRLAEVARDHPAESYINIQGDEPLLDPVDIDRLVECLESESAPDIGTLCRPLEDPRAAADPNVVKVVCDLQGRALYFSRCAIPCVRPPGARDAGADAPAPTPWMRHVGIYAYRRDTLLEFASWPRTPMESIEGLEQLRALEHGRVVRVLPARGAYLSVDIPEDIIAVERALGTSS